MPDILIKIQYFLLGAFVSLFLLIFFCNSIREKKRRTSVLSIILLIIFCLVWTSLFFLLKSINIYFVLFPVIVVFVLVFLFFVPFGRTDSIKIGEITERIDERDIIFAREEYLPGTDRYAEYYKMRPELKKIDDKIRKLPRLLEFGSKYYDPVKSQYVRSVFDVISYLKPLTDGKINPPKKPQDKEKISKLIKEFTKTLGASKVGITELNPAFIYSNEGRNPDTWGNPVNLNHKYAIAFTVEMDYFQVEKAPQIEITEESAKQYLRAAYISIVLGKFIRSLGFDALAHIDAHYKIIMPAVAYNAGIGELGRNGYLITPQSGARARIGAVTTDLSLMPDKPIAFGVQDFCEKCRKCAINCPAGAIPHGDKNEVRGVKKWQINVEKCLYYWRFIGTDCGLCMKVCPFSHPKSTVHNLIRIGIKRSTFARKISAIGDDIFYGKKIEF